MGLGRFCEFGGHWRDQGAADGRGRVFICGLLSSLQKAARQEFVFSRLMSGKAGEEAYHGGPGVAYRSGGVSLRRDEAACLARLHCGVCVDLSRNEGDHSHCASPSIETRFFRMRHTKMYYIWSVVLALVVLCPG